MTLDLVLEHHLRTAGRRASVSRAAQNQSVVFSVSGGSDVSKRSSVAAMPVRESVRGPIIG